MSGLILRVDRENRIKSIKSVAVQISYTNERAEYLQWNTCDNLTQGPKGILLGRQLRVFIIYLPNVKEADLAHSQSSFGGTPAPAGGRSIAEDPEIWHSVLRAVFPECATNSIGHSRLSHWKNLLLSTS